MARNFQINGETLVRVQGGEHMSGGAIGRLSELGLSDEPIRIMPRFTHKDIHCDDFGPDIPAEIQWQLAEVQIRMSLIHYDRTVLDVCLEESMGGQTQGFFGAAGKAMAPGGSLLGNGKPLFASGNHYQSVYLSSPQMSYPWHFRACYLLTQPMEIPLGTKTTIPNLIFRCIPYAYPSLTLTSGEVSSSGVNLWDHELP